MASREVIEQVATANDIVEVIGEYFPLQRAGTNYKALSPFTNEKTASFYVNPSKQAFFCFSSQQGGDVFKFIQLYENVSFKDALKKLADRARIHLDEEISAEEKAEQRLIRQLREVHRLAAEWYHTLLLKNPAAADAREYLKNRGFGIETARNWQLGYAPQSSRAFEDWAKQHKLSNFLLLKAGLMRKSQDGRGSYAFFRHRLMFPICNDYGDTIAFSGRVLSPDQKGGKYVNSPESPLFQKSRNFFGLHKSKRAILQAGRAILCEGQIDMISAYEHGVENVVAPLGTAFTELQARLLRRHTEEVVICFDADRAGQKAANEAFSYLAQVGVVVRVAKMPQGDDPDSMIKRDGVDAYKKVIDEAEEYFDYQIRLGIAAEGDTIRDKAQLAHRLAEKIAFVEDSLKQNLLIDKLATRLGMPTSEIAKLVKDAQRNKNREKYRRSEKEEANKPATEVMPLPRWHVMQTLCRLLLTSNEARQFIQKEGDRSLLQHIPESELLSHLWEGELDTENPASLPTFLNSLPIAVQNAASRLLVEPGPTGDGQLAKDCYQAILRQSLENQRHECRGRMSTPGLNPEKLRGLLAEYKELEDRLKELPRPRTPLDEE